MNVIELIATVILFSLWAGVWFVVSRFLQSKGVWKIPSHVLAGVSGFLAGVMAMGIVFSLVGNSEEPGSTPQIENAIPEERIYNSNLGLGVVEESLWSWDPLDVRLTGNALLIITQESRVTDQIYKAVIMSGICPVYWRNPEASLRVNEIRVLNRFGRQGYVFEGEADICHWLGQQQGGDRYIPGFTRLYTND